MRMGHERAMTRLAELVRRGRPGPGHETSVDGHTVTGWRGWDENSKTAGVGLWIRSRDVAEAERLARRYYGHLWLEASCWVKPGEAIYWLPLDGTAGSTPPRPPFYRRSYDPRRLAAGIGEQAGALRMGRYALVAAE